MSTARMLAFIFPAVLAADRAAACDLELSIRLHPRYVIYGDPVYVELTIANRGDKAVTASPRDYHGDRLWFEIRNAERRLQTWAMDVPGERSPSEIPAGKEITFYQYLFLPSLYDFDHPFWKSAHGTFYIRATYPIRPGLVLVSEFHPVVIDRRPKREMRALREWSQKDDQVTVMEPTPRYLGIMFKRPLNMEETASVASVVDWSGSELGYLLNLTLQLQRLYRTPPESRDAQNKALVRELKRHPEIKRRALTAVVRSIAGNRRMSSTVEALDAMEADEAP